MVSVSVIKRGEGVLSTEVDGETVLMSIESGRYYTLDSVGSVVWSLLETSQTLQGIQEQLVERFEGDAETIRKEANEYLQKLVDRKLVKTN